MTLEGTDVQHADIEHVAFRVPRANKVEALVNVLRLTGSDRAMLFCRTKPETEEICPPSDRRRFYRRLPARRPRPAGTQPGPRRFPATASCNMLVATEVAARGIDVPGVAHVVNVDLPFNLDAYIHRSGRTGRAGQKGICFSLVRPEPAAGLPPHDRRRPDQSRLA